MRSKGFVTGQASQLRSIHFWAIFVPASSRGCRDFGDSGDHAGVSQRVVVVALSGSADVASGLPAFKVEARDEILDLASRMYRRHVLATAAPEAGIIRTPPCGDSRTGTSRR